MQIEPLLMFGEEEKHIICKQCGKEIDVPATITVKEFNELPSYLDGFKKGLEDKYFECKFFGCDNCGWFLKAPYFHSCVYGDKPSKEIMKILNSDIDTLEKRCLINYMMRPQKLTNILELYWYYDIKAQDIEKASAYRKLLLKSIKKEVATKDGFNIYQLTYIDLLRRDGQFKKAIKLTEDYLKFASTKKVILEQQLKLCQEKDTNRH